MIFLCDKKVKPPFLDKDDGIRQQPPSQKQTNGLFCIRVLFENIKAFRTPYLEKTAAATRVIRTVPLLVSDVRNL